MKAIRKGMFLLLAALLCAALLQGCANNGSSGAPAASGTGKATKGSTTSAGPKASAAPAATKVPKATKSPVQAFADAFKTVEQNPLNADIQLILWEAAKNPASPDSTNPGQGSALQQLVAKYQAIVADQGVHYVQVTSYMGMDMSSELWIKNGKFKKIEGDKVTVYDGKDYVEYKTAKKTGTRYTKDDMGVDADIDITLSGTLSKLAVAGYQQQKDAKYGKFDCSVFYLEMTVMGMKGSWLYVDKATGMLVNNQTGNPKDKKNSMSVHVKSLAVGGFDDSVFTVPADVTVKDYQP